MGILAYAFSTFAIVSGVDDDRLRTGLPLPERDQSLNHDEGLKGPPIPQGIGIGAPANTAQEAATPADGAPMDAIELPMDLWDDPEMVWALLAAIGGSI
jgi:hypothetical protein